MGTEQEMGRLTGTAIALRLSHYPHRRARSASDRIDYLGRGNLYGFVRRHREPQIGKKEWAARSGSAKLCKRRTTDGIRPGLAWSVVPFVTLPYSFTEYVSYVF